jgi:hypothetical protein
LEVILAAKQSQSTLFHLDIPLSEMRRSFQAQSDGIDSIKGTIKTVFGSASLIVSLIGALQLFTTTVAPQWLPWYQIALVVIAVLYLALIIVCVAGMWPAYLYPPLNPKWDELTTTFQNMNEQEMTTMYLSAVLKAIQLNKPIVRRFVRLEITALILLPILVLLILFLAWLPRG